MPKEYFLKDMENEDQLENMAVPRGDKLCLSYEVTKPGSILRFSFVLSSVLLLLWLLTCVCVCV